MKKVICNQANNFERCSLIDCDHRIPHEKDYVGKGWCTEWAPCSSLDSQSIKVRCIFLKKTCHLCGSNDIIKGKNICHDCYFEMATGWED